MNNKSISSLTWLLLAVALFLLSRSELPINTRWILFSLLVLTGIFLAYFTFIKRNKDDKELEKSKTKNIVAVIAISISLMIGFVYFFI